MTIDRFSKETFDAFAEEKGIEHSGFRHGEHVYMLNLSEWARVEIRSSLGMDGYAKADSDDSIRAWLVYYKPDWKTGKIGWYPALTKDQAKTIGLARWVTRKEGWQSRLSAHLEKLKEMTVKRPVEMCPKCGKAPAVYVVKKRNGNFMRPFAMHKTCGGNYFQFLDEPLPDIDIEEYDEPETVKIEPDENPFDTVFNAKSAPVQAKQEIVTVQAPDIVVNTFEVNSMRTEQQKDYILAPQKNIRFLATAGSGKTTSIIDRIAALIYKHGVSPKNIVAVTFGALAADEIKNRLFESYPELKHTPLGGRICTIHALNGRLLKLVGVEKQVITKKEREQWWQITDFLEETREAIWYDKKRGRPAVGELMRAFHEVKYYGIPVNHDAEYQTMRHGAEYGPGLQQARSKFDAFMDYNGWWFFDDMMFLFEQELIWNQQFREMLQAVIHVLIVDESQDTNYQAMRSLLTVSQEPGWNKIYENFGGSFS